VSILVILFKKLKVASMEDLVALGVENSGFLLEESTGKLSIRGCLAWRPVWVDARSQNSQDILG
jgi:hypothetical protein